MVVCTCMCSTLCLYTSACASAQTFLAVSGHVRVGVQMQPQVHVPHFRAFCTAAAAIESVIGASAGNCTRSVAEVCCGLRGGWCGVMGQPVLRSVFMPSASTPPMPCDVARTLE